MDFTSDFNDPYYAAIRKEERHTRVYCNLHGGTRPRHFLRYCEHCPGNYCVDCAPFHEKAEKALHRKPQAKTIKLLEIETLSAMPRATPIKDPVRKYRQLRLNFGPIK